MTKQACIAGQLGDVRQYRLTTRPQAKSPDSGPAAHLMACTAAEQLACWQSPDPDPDPQTHIASPPLLLPVAMRTSLNCMPWLCSTRQLVVTFSRAVMLASPVKVVVAAAESAAKWPGSTCQVRL